ncbi:MAG: hypothetical protein K6B46_01220 [Opitutales bacterium]|nr:hypothetical protein [Opitutales bacterium]
MFAAIAMLVPAFAVWHIRGYTYRIPEDRTRLFIGDSYIAQGVDDTVVPAAFNCSVSADSFLTGFLRLRLLLRDNPQIDTVFLSVSPYNLSRGADETVFRPSLVAMKVPYYLAHFGSEEWRVYGERVPADFLRAVAGTPTVYLRKSKLDNKKYFKKLGAFNPRDNRTLDKALAGTETLERDPAGGNAIQRRYLKKIENFCREKNLRLVFLCTPVYRAEHYCDLDYFYALLKSDFPAVEFWDYMDFEMPDEEREDVGHLNSFGARHFGQVLAERLAAESVPATAVPAVQN